MYLFTLTEYDDGWDSLDFMFLTNQRTIRYIYIRYLTPLSSPTQSALLWLFQGALKCVTTICDDAVVKAQRRSIIRSVLIVGHQSYPPSVSASA